MPDTETDHHRGDAAVARLDIVAPPAAPAATSSSSCATATARDEEEEEDGFTFSPVAVTVPRLQATDCAFPDARIGGPVYPVFGRPRWSPPKEEQQQQDEEEEGPGAAGTTATVRLLLEDPWCDCAPSASGQQLQPADDADAELDGVPAETYCLWSPGVSPPASAGSPRASPARCRKSGSTGSPVLRWRRRRVVVDVERSHSDGKDRFVFLATSSDRDAGEGHGWMNRGKSTMTSFLRCKQDLVELVASAITCRRSCYLF